MNTYQAKYENNVTYASRSNKKALDSLFKAKIIFERTMVKTGLVAITFPDLKGADQLLKNLLKLMKEDSVEFHNLIVVKKNKKGAFQVIKSIESDTINCYPLDFVVGLLLRGSIADKLLGSAAATLLAHPIDLGMPQKNVDMLFHDLGAGSSVLFLQDCANFNGLFKRAFDQSNGKLHNLSMTRQAITEINIMVSTLRHYWI